MILDGETVMLERTNDNSSFRLVSTIVSAYVSNNKIPPDQLPDLIRTVHDALMNPEEAPAERLEPAVPIKKSVRPDYIVCLEDGKKLKMLKRHLRTSFGMSPDEYRAKWSLPSDYPMVAPKYAKTRSELAKKIGLGRKARGKGKA
jgi:predicted transcriptional regulator